MGGGAPSLPELKAGRYYPTYGQVSAIRICPRYGQSDLEVSPEKSEWVFIRMYAGGAPVAPSLRLLEAQ